jgi:hypothetical protein
VSATGDITSAVNKYRVSLGHSANVVGEARRAPRDQLGQRAAAFTNNDLFPGNFFNVNSRAACIYDGRVSIQISDRYVDVNPNYASQFNTASPPKLFAPRGGTVVDVQFVVAGTNTPAAVTGFGSVFGMSAGRIRRPSSTSTLWTPTADRQGASSDRCDRTLVSARSSVACGCTRSDHLGRTPIDATANDNVKAPETGHRRDGRLHLRRAPRRTDRSSAGSTIEYVLPAASLGDGDAHGPAASVARPY